MLFRQTEVQIRWVYTLIMLLYQPVIFILVLIDSLFCHLTSSAP